MGEKYPALRYSDNMGGNFKNGVWNIECDSWRKFVDKMEEFKRPKYKYVWRGQSCKETLKPSIYRDFTPNDKTIEQHLCQFRKDTPGGDALEQFLERAKKEGTSEFEEALSEYYKMIHPKEDANDSKENYEKDFIDNIYWAIGRHHGLKTPLLDWTMDPYKALFFAFCERKEKDDKRVVFGLAEKSRLLLDKRQQTKRYIEFLANLGFVETVLGSSDSPTDVKEGIGRMFGRIRAQEGLFTRTLYNEDIEEHIKECHRVYKKRSNEEIVFLIKILLPDGVREDFLQKLEGMKITYKTMYPDLLGAVLYCNLKLEPCSRAL
jgi:hypothetical protein